MEDEEEVTSDVIYVGNLPKHITEDEIHTYFKQFGKILSIKLVKSAKVCYKMISILVSSPNVQISRRVAVDSLIDHAI